MTNTTLARFGERTIRRGFLTPHQLSDCLNIQKILNDFGISKMIGVIMQEKGYLTPSQVQEIVYEIGGSTAHPINDYLDVLTKTLGGGAKEAGFLAEHWARCNEPVKGDKNDSYPLHLAAMNEWKDAAALFLSKGADVNAKDNDGKAPLHYAAMYDRKDAAALLIEKGADVNAKDNSGMTPLHRAAWLNGKDTAALLIERDADVNAKDNDGKTPLHWAAWWRCKDVVALLIEKGADVNAKDNDGKAPRHLAKDTEGLSELNIQ